MLGRGEERREEGGESSGFEFKVQSRTMGCGLWRVRRAHTERDFGGMAEWRRRILRIS